MKQHTINVNAEICIGCGLCQRDCPENNICIIDKKAVIKEQDCTKCGHCAAVCPKAAVSMTGFDEPPMEFSQRTILEPQQLLQAIKTRRSIRQFKFQEVPAEIIQKIIEAGRFTPTAVNAQNVSYFVVRDEKEKIEKEAVRFFRKLWPAAALFVKKARGIVIDDHFFFKNASAAIIVMSENKVNGALAASNMALMAEACGLGVLYSGFFTIAANYSGRLRRTLHLKRKDKVVTTLVIGYPDVSYHRTAYRETASVRYI